MRAAILVLLSALSTSTAHASGPSIAQTPAGFAEWRTAAPGRTARVAAFDAFLRRNRVGGVLPLDQVLRTDERYRRCGDPFDLPPQGQWRDIVPTLRLIRDEVKPAVGEVVVVSGFRRPGMNRCIGGASRSRHLGFGALDLKPTAAMSRKALDGRLCGLHARKGPARAMGLGLYPVNRFHVDTSGFRSWGQDYTRKTSPCRRA